MPLKIRGVVLMLLMMIAIVMTVVMVMRWADCVVAGVVRAALRRLGGNGVLVSGRVAQRGRRLERRGALRERRRTLSDCGRGQGDAGT